MKSLLAPVLALGLLGAAASAAPAEAASVGIYVGSPGYYHDRGYHRGYYHDRDYDRDYWRARYHRHHMRYCRDWSYRYHDRYCRGWGSFPARPLETLTKWQPIVFSSVCVKP